MLEKAYFKVKGGYSHGSLAINDMQILFGWIPEIISLDANLDQELTWVRLQEGFQTGECMVIFCTGKIGTTEDISIPGARTVSEQTGLLSLHAYACLDVRYCSAFSGLINIRTVEQHGLFLLKLRNPWGRSRWKGRFSEFDYKSWTPELQKILDYDLKGRQDYDDGVFWIDYKSAIE